MTRLTKALLLVGGVLLGLSQGYADDSCGYARDGACDELLLAPPTPTERIAPACRQKSGRASPTTPPRTTIPFPSTIRLPAGSGGAESAAWSAPSCWRTRLDPDTMLLWLVIGGVVLAFIFGARKGPPRPIRSGTWSGGR